LIATTRLIRGDFLRRNWFSEQIVEKIKSVSVIATSFCPPCSDIYNKRRVPLTLVCWHPTNLFGNLYHRLPTPDLSPVAEIPSLRQGSPCHGARHVSDFDFVLKDQCSQLFGYSQYHQLPLNEVLDSISVPRVQSG
jgi:hypothetical protein